MIAYPEIIEYQVVKVLFLNKVGKLGATVSESAQKEPHAKAVKTKLGSQGTWSGVMTKRT